MYESPVVEELGLLASIVELTGSLNALDGEMFNS